MTTRRLAAMAGTTTQAIYTEFGGKEGIARAMYREGFAAARSAHARRSAQTDDPFFDLLQQGRVYRESALERPHFYDVMFGRPIPQFTPDADDLAVSRIAHDLLVGRHRARDRDRRARARRRAPTTSRSGSGPSCTAW